jgi:hypothetical protein
VVAPGGHVRRVPHRRHGRRRRTRHPAPVRPAALALTSALLTLYLVLVDAAPSQRRRALVPAGTAAVAIAAVTLAAYLPTRPWAALVGMAAAATALVTAVGALRRRARTGARPRGAAVRGARR